MAIHPQLDRDRLLKTLVERENLGSTGIGGGVAIPHGKFDGLDKLASSFGKSPRGIDFSFYGQQTCLHLLPSRSAQKLCRRPSQGLARISRLLKDPLLLSSLQRAQSGDDIYRVLEEDRPSIAVTGTG